MRLISLFIFIFIISAFNCYAQYRTLAETVFRADRHNMYFPHISKDYTFVDLGSSYLIQKAYTEKKLAEDKKSGYKAALTSKKAQARFSAPGPVSGVLFGSGKSLSPSIISLKEYRNMLIEPELGFLVDKDIIQTIESRDSLGDFVSAVYPIIELPDVGFENLSEVTVIDIICTNAGAKKYIVGNKNLIENLDLNNIKTRLYRDGKLISSGTSSEVMQGQKSALLWLINDLISKNYEIKSGYILLTGSIGEAYKASQGQYMADFGKLGKIYFEIR